MMFNHLTEQFRFPDYQTVAVGGDERPGGDLDVQGADILTEFRLEMGLPVWRYESHGHVIEKRVFMPHRRNTVHVVYRLVEGDGPVRLKLRPSVHFRGHDDPVSTQTPEPYTLTAIDRPVRAGRPGHAVPAAAAVDRRATTPGSPWTGCRSPEILYRVEENRGYEGVGLLWSPGVFRVDARAATGRWR